MLQELQVKDFAIIDSLHLSFKEGLTVLSGETGAGKSIIVGALLLLMGGRASTELIRSAKDEAVVEALFDISNCPEVKDILISGGIEIPENQLVVRRTISRSGKNKIFIGDRLATIQLLSRIGGRLIDISGQYSQQLLLQVEQHIEILDAFGDAFGLREDYHRDFTAFQKLEQELKAILTLEEECIRKKELYTFQNEEITKAALSEGEDEALVKEKNILLNAQNLYEKTYGIYLNIYENEDASLNVLKKATIDLDDASRIDDRLRMMKESLDSAVITLEDTAFSLRDYAKRIEMNPERLEAVEDRLEEIKRLKRKYGNSIEEIVAYQGKIQKELESIEGSSERITELRKELKVSAESLWAKAEMLSGKRKKAAVKLKGLIEKELATIGMDKVNFLVQIERGKRADIASGDDLIKGLNQCGMDTVEFFISPNKGEEPKPLSKIASGGEISRIVLALKKILAGNYRVPTLLFDEVDAGIGGAVAEAVGMKLKEIAASHQVFCITHLAQIACFGADHFNVSKNVNKRRTVTQVELLDYETRLDEISRMLGGRNISEKTRAHAREMLQNAGDRR